MKRYYAFDKKRRGFLGKGYHNDLAHADTRHAGTWARKRDAEAAIRLKLDCPRPEFSHGDIVILEIDLAPLLGAALRDAGIEGVEGVEIGGVK